MTTTTQPPQADNVQQHVFDLIQQATGHKRLITVPRALLDFMEGDRVAATVLSQLLYWSARATQPNAWIYKSYIEWQEELGLSEYQVRRVIYGDKRVKKVKKLLPHVGVEVELKKSPKGAPTLHYRIDRPMFFALFVDFLEAQYGFAPSPQVEPDTPEPVEPQPAPPEQCQESMPDNVQNPSQTMSRIDSEQCAPSSLAKNTSQKSGQNITISESAPHEEETLKGWVVFADYERFFGNARQEMKQSLIEQLERHTIGTVKNLIERCRAYEGRSWNYVLTTLQNEPATKQNNYTQMFRDITENYELPVTETVQADCPATGEGCSTASDVWEQAREQLKGEMSAAHFAMWINTLILVDFEPENAVFAFAAVSDHAVLLLKNGLSFQLEQLLAKFYGQPVDLHFYTQEDWRREFELRRLSVAGIAAAD